MEAKIKLYKFNELKKEIQEKLINEEIEEQKNFYCEMCLNADMIDKASELLKEYFNIQNGCDDVYYDLSYSQGSGSMIEFTINIEDLNKKYNILNNEELRFIQDKGIINNINIIHGNSNYNHEYTFTINYYDNFGYWSYEDIKEDYNIKEEEFNTIEDRIIDLLDDYNKHYTKSNFIEDIINMNRDLTKYGYELIEDEENFKNEAINYLEENETLYFEDGRIFNYDYEVISNE